MSEPYTIRLDDGGVFDELVVPFCAVHMERMGDDEWYMSITVPGEEEAIRICWTGSVPLVETPDCIFDKGTADPPAKEGDHA